MGFDCINARPLPLYLLYLGQIHYSCTPDKVIRVFHLYLQILSHPCYLTRDRIKNHVYLMHWLYRKSRIYGRQVTLDFTAVTSK